MNEITIKIAKIQIFSSLLVTLGGVFFGLGAGAYFISRTIMSTETYSEGLGYFVNTLNEAGISFLILGSVSLMLGWILPILMINFLQKKQ